MKSIVLFVSPFVDKKSRPIYEKLIRGTILRDDLNVNLKFIYEETNNLALNLWLKIKKNESKVVVFHKCQATAVKEHHDVLEKQKGTGRMLFFHNETSGVLDEKIRDKVKPLNTLKFLPVQIALMVG